MVKHISYLFHLKSLNLKKILQKGAVVKVPNGKEKNLPWI